MRRRQPPGTADRVAPQRLSFPVTRNVAGTMRARMCSPVTMAKPMNSAW